MDYGIGIASLLALLMIGRAGSPIKRTYQRRNSFIALAFVFIAAMGSAIILNTRPESPAAIDTASASITRPVDAPLPIWAGIVPTETTLLEPIADPRNLDGVALPDHVANFKLRGK